MSAFDSIILDNPLVMTAEKGEAFFMSSEWNSYPELVSTQIFEMLKESSSLIWNWCLDSYPNETRSSFFATLDCAYSQ